jgi:SAM-dependent methyltransferase
VSLLDFSPRAIEISRQVFARRGLAATYVQASMFDIPLQAGQYDVVFSLGVLEHWPANLQQQALGEMSRVCRPGGTLLMVVPYRWAAAYRLGKWYAERRGFWAFGPETPMTSLAGFALPGMRLAREYTIGSIDQLRFLGYLPGGKVIRKGVDFLQRNYWRLNHSLPGGWLLVSVFRKEAV